MRNSEGDPDGGLTKHRRPAQQDDVVGIAR